MAAALLMARLVLAAVFLLAGLAKLADLAGSRQTLREFGLPARLTAPFGILLPLAELAVAVALVPLGAAWWGGLGALALLLLFMAGIGVNLARGRTPDCRCFGQLHSAPIGWPTLARNGLLAAVASFVVGWGRGTPGSSAVGWLGSLTGAQAAALAGAVMVLALLAGMGWLLLQLLEQNGRLLVRLEAVEAQLASTGLAPEPERTAPVAGLPVGTPAPAFALPDLTGEIHSLDALRAAGRPVLLLFSDPGCGPCTALLPEVARWQRERAGALTITLVSRGTREANQAKAAAHGIGPVLLQDDREVAATYQAGGTPSAVLVYPDGAIGSPLAQGAEAIRALVARALGQPIVPSRANGHIHNGHAAPAPLPPLHVGDPAPALRLPDLDGSPLDLDTLRGERRLVLFWNPGCGFCQRMLDDLKAWEAHPPAGAPRLLVISTGTVEANRALDLRSPIVLDQGLAMGRAFGAGGTPMAMLVDAEGKIASNLAVGASAVLALAGGDPAATRP
jgi:peroxiredoxin